MQCKWHKCSNESRTRSPFCSETCKKRHARRSGTNGGTELSGTEGFVPVQRQVGQAELESACARRKEPSKLNWGPWMNSDELKANKFKANRVSIPGDWDN